MIVFLLLLLLVGILVYYWQKEPILIEKFVSSDSTAFESIIPTVDVNRQQMNGPVYMFYALTSNYKIGNSGALTAGIPVNYIHSENLYMNMFKNMTDIQLRVATEKERQYFLRNGGINREGTTYTLTRESGAGVNGVFPSLINAAKLVVSAKPPNKQWNQIPGVPIVFATNESNITVETLVEGTIFHSIIRYPFNDKQQLFEINVDDYKQSISDCLFIGKKISQNLATTGIRAYELNPAAPLNENIGTGAFISYEDTNVNNTVGTGGPGSSSSNTVRGSSSSNTQNTNISSYNAAISGQTPNNIKQKLALLDTRLNEESTFVDADNTKLTWRKALQQKCGATIFNKLRFEGTPDPESCKLATNTLSRYFIKFNKYENLLECSLITPEDKLANIIESLTEQPVKPSTGFASAQPDSSGVILKMNNLKLGNEYTYELQLNDESNTEDNSSKYIFSPFRFTAGKQNQANADITNLHIIINENSDKIDIVSVKTNTRTLLGQIDKPATFKLYSSIRLRAIIYTFPNKSITNPTKSYSFTHIEQDTSFNSRYELYISDIYDNTTKSTIIDFMYINANTIQATFTINNKSSIIPAGNYTFVFEDAATGSFIDAANANLNTKQFTRIQINVLSGDIDFYNNTTKITTIKSTFKEQAAPINFKLALNDPSNKLTYFGGNYQAFGNRYDGVQKITTINFGNSQGSSSSSNASTQAQTQTQAQTDDREVVYIETPVTDGIDADTALKVAQNLGMQIATIDQVVQAMKDNANWCSAGWCEFTDISGRKVLRAAYPLTSQITDAKCITQDDSIALYNQGVVVVSTPTTLKAQLMVYRKKDNIPSNLTVNNQIFKQSYFNAMIGLWKRDSNTAINDNEIFAITKQEGAIASNDIANLVKNLKHCTVATEQQIERQLEYIKGKNLPLPNIMEVGWALDNKNIPIKIMLNGKLTKLPASTSFVNSVYCYGNKQNSNGRLDNDGKFIKLPNENEANNANSNNTDNNIYKIQAYNAELNIANQNDNINYKPLIFKTKPLIDQVKKYNAKGALILKEVQDTPSGVVREGFTASYKDIYAGCDVNSYGCIALSGSGEKPAPPPLVSKNGKFQILKMESINGNVFENPTSIAQGIQNARDCQAAGGDIAITDDTYPGCPAGYCCEPVEDNTLLDTSMFAETCDDSNMENAVDKCDDNEEVLPLHQQAFEPYKLTRVQRTKTPTTAKCSKPKLSKSLKETFQNTPEYMRDVHQITKNERMFSLKFNPT